MKVVCDREKLREGLAVANNVIPTKSAKPVLENVYFVANDDGLELAGTDAEVSLRYRIEDVEVVEPGTAVIPARVTADFVRDLAGDKVILETHEGNCTISSGTDRCELVTIDPDEFPVISRFTDEKTFTMRAGVFTKLVSQTGFAAAREPGRYAMHGVLTEIEDGVLKLVATDGRRLALSTIPIETDDGAKATAIVPTKGLQHFCRVISDELDPVRLHFGETQLGMKTRDAEIFVRLIDGEFPRYAAVIPTTTKHYLEADADTLSKKLRLVANVTGDEARAVKFRMGEKKLELFGQSAGRGEATAQVEVEFKGDETEIAFNPDYVLDGLKKCEGELVKLEFDERTSPGKFSLGENYMYIVMPITVDA